MENSKFKKAVVLFKDELAGVIEKVEAGYRFTYDNEFMKKNRPISLSLPLTQRVYESDNLFPFFAGLLLEGWYLDIAAKKLKIDKNDAFGFLLATCEETIGAVTIRALK
ncbi:MAG: HipA N-terminal domain-containing protein [Candidatus Omnitrophica bacterium]|nr:HipA N-terminal domain-containing protein [Candidatus Omnitrophota bacterium]MBU0879116.1 HipA N-terminal domain-containing protein [Candidatus Omnitrophota bacterium]MBU1133412.1 HipA N-terminal domain-containing protein [Candidatus Omnitrophota bacterium]MBU1367219.1 HipA N-terminal domain-containing protein [Candidatus Omnitrophota bacterium]MBU1523390.1 HipA N-terminal domain-containing protein [Candidatus Omnitrophota bacterium]